jgi:proton-dependent oligopeptide transporter, POT family
MLADSSASATDDVKQLGFVAGFLSLSYVFWVVGAMEMVERLAYYGVKAVATLYAKDPVSAGGLGVTMTDFGSILSAWALVQCLVPVFTGALSDRYGYKETIAASTVVKIVGYLIMATFPTYWGFFAGAMVLATGTAIFKPGIQGTLVKATRRENSSLAWGIFYQTVNIGGFLGPLMAGYMRKMEWRYVFLSCAAIICLNFLLLLTYKEPGKAERIAAQATQPKVTMATAITELSRPHVWPYLLIFSGFWFMFNAIFDVLPAHLDDWVDTRDIVATLFGAHATPGPIVSFFVNMNASKTEILPEGMLNLNAMLIMLTCFAFAWLSGKMKAIHSMVLGTLLASIAMLGTGMSVLGWVSVAAIAVFSVGEMMSSPKFSEYVGNFAPSDKKAMYLGFAQIPIAIGWTLEGKLGMTMYDHFGSKERFAREMLVERGMTQDAVAAIPQGEGFLKLCESLGQDKFEVTHLLLQTHNPGQVWYLMAGIGVLSAMGIWWYGSWVKKLSAAGASARA